MAIFKILGTKVSCFIVLYEVTKMNVFFHFSAGVAEILSMGLSFSLTDFSMSLMVEELFLLRQKNSYVMFN